MFEAAGFSEPTIGIWKLAIEFKTWIAKIGTPADRIAALEAVFSELPSEMREYFQITPEGSFIIDSGWIEGRCG